MEFTRIQVPVEYSVKVKRHIRRRFGIVDIDLRTISGEEAPFAVEWTPTVWERVPDEEPMRFRRADADLLRYRSFGGELWLPAMVGWTLVDLVGPVDWAGAEGAEMADRHPFRHRPMVDVKPDWDDAPYRPHPEGNALFDLLARRAVDRSARYMVVDGQLWEARTGPLLEFQHLPGEPPTIGYGEGVFSTRRYFWSIGNTFDGFGLEDALRVLQPIYGEVLVEGNAPVRLVGDIGVEQCPLEALEESAAWAMLRYLAHMPVSMLTLEIVGATVGLRNAVQALSPDRELDFTDIGDTMAGKLTRVAGRDDGILVEPVRAMIQACRHLMKGGHDRYWQTVLARLAPLSPLGSRDMDDDAMADVDFL